MPRRGGYLPPPTSFIFGAGQGNDIPGMVAMRSLGRQFGWLWGSVCGSTFGTCLAFEAYPLIAWGLLADITGPRAAIAIAGVLLLLTPILLPRRDRAWRQPIESAQKHA